MSTRVREYMSEDYHTINSAVALQEVTEKMVQNSLEFIVVVDDANRYVGVLTEVDIIKLRNRSDLLQHGVARDIAEVLPVPTVNPDGSMDSVADIIENFPNVDQVIVVDGRQVLGVVTKALILRWFYKSLKDG